MRLIRTYLLVYTGNAWECSIHRDYESLYETWMKYYDSQQSTGVIHVGINRPDIEAFKDCVARYEGRMVLTGSARWAFFPFSQCDPVSIGKAEGIPLYIALNGWGYDISPADLGIIQASPTDIHEEQNTVKVQQQDKLLLSIKELNLPIRAENCLAAANISLIGDLVKCTESYLIKLPNFGAGSLRAINRALLNFKLRLTQPFDLNSTDADTFTNPLSSFNENNQNLFKIPHWLSSAPLEKLNLQARTFRALSSAGVNNIGDLEKFSSEILLRIPNFGQTSLADVFQQLNFAIKRSSNSAYDSQGLIEDEVSTSIVNPQRLGSAFKLQGGLLEVITSVISSLPENSKEIISARMGMPPLDPMTLQEVGEFIGVTRERIRQIEAKVMMRLGQDPVWADVLEEKLNKLLEDRTDALPINGLAILDPWFKGVENLTAPLNYILKQKHILNHRFSIFDVNGQLILSNLSQDEWGNALHLAMKLLEDSVEKKIRLSEAIYLVEELLPGKGRELRSELWMAAKRFAHFSAESINDEPVLVSYGRGTDALVEAVLIESDRPLHYSEIRECVEARYGKDIPIRRAHNSAAKVGLSYGKGFYGLMKHCQLTSQEIALVREEIIDEICSGVITRQWSNTELMDVLHSRGIDFGDKLNIHILNVVLMGVNEITYLGRGVYQSSEVALNRPRRIDIRQAVISLLIQAGRPMTNKEIKDSLKQDRGISDNFQIQPTGPLINVGAGLWGLIERDMPINTEQQEELRLIIRQILLDRKTGIHITEIENCLKNVYEPALLITDPAGLFAIALRSSEFRKSPEDYLYLSDWGEPRRIGKYQALQDVLNSAGKTGLTINEILKRANNIVGREITRNGLSRVLNELGAKYYVDENIWKMISEFDEIDE
jgi:hypothetical protein